MCCMACTPWYDVEDLPCDASSAAASGLTAVAIDWVNRATGFRWPGVCEATIRPATGCGHRTGCGCGSYARSIDLAHDGVVVPIVEIVELSVAGELAAEGVDYLLEGSRFLRPLAGGMLDPLPVQRLDVPLGEPDTWSVAVRFGSRPPAAVLWATKELNCQLVKRSRGQKCELPDNTTSVSSDGVTITFDVPANGKTGIPRIDTILSMYPAQRGGRIIDPARQRNSVTFS